jgi:hypothetical protein
MLPFAPVCVARLGRAKEGQARGHAHLKLNAAAGHCQASVAASAGAKVFWFFFSKKNTSSYLGFLARVAREGACYIRSPRRRNRMPKLLAAILVLLPLSAHASGLTVFAAASLTDAFRDIGGRRVRQRR